MTKNVFILTLLLFSFVGFSQKPNQPSVAQQGYQIGCQLAKDYNNSSIASIRASYLATVNSTIHSAAYRNGVRDGWATCIKGATVSKEKTCIRRHQSGDKMITTKVPCSKYPKVNY